MTILCDNYDLYDPYDIVTYCDIYDCKDCPRYGDDCDGKGEDEDELV